MGSRGKVVGVRRDLVDGRMIEVKVYAPGPKPTKSAIMIQVGNRNSGAAPKGKGIQRFSRSHPKSTGTWIGKGSKRRPDHTAQHAEKVAAFKGDGEFDPEDY